MLPIVERLLANNAVDRTQRGRTPRVIVLAPTRELAKQVGLAKALFHCLKVVAKHVKVSYMVPGGCLAMQVQKD